MESLVIQQWNIQQCTSVASDTEPVNATEQEVCIRTFCWVAIFCTYNRYLKHSNTEYAYLPSHKRRRRSRKTTTTWIVKKFTLLWQFGTPAPCLNIWTWLCRFRNISFSIVDVMDICQLHILIVCVCVVCVLCMSCECFKHHISAWKYFLPKVTNRNFKWKFISSHRSSK